MTCELCNSKYSFRVWELTTDFEPYWIRHSYCLNCLIEYLRTVDIDSVIVIEDRLILTRELHTYTCSRCGEYKARFRLFYNPERVHSSLLSVVCLDCIREILSNRGSPLTLLYPRGELSDM